MKACRAPDGLFAFPKDLVGPSIPVAVILSGHMLIMLSSPQYPFSPSKC